MFASKIVLSLIMIYCSDFRNHNFERMVEAYLPKADLIHAYSVRRPGGVYPMIHGLEDIREDFLEELHILLGKVGVKNPIIVLAHHKGCARYHSKGGKEQEADVLESKRIIEKRFEALHPKVLLFMVDMDKEQILKIIQRE